MFDSNNWDSLLLLLSIRGFPPTWISWIKTLLSSGKTMILLNGISGPWINCKKWPSLGRPHIAIYIHHCRRPASAHNPASWLTRRPPPPSLPKLTSDRSLICQRHAHHRSCFHSCSFPAQEKLRQLRPSYRPRHQLPQNHFRTHPHWPCRHCPEHCQLIRMSYILLLLGISRVAFLPRETTLLCLWTYNPKFLILSPGMGGKASLSWSPSNLTPVHSRLCRYPLHVCLSHPKEDHQNPRCYPQILLLDCGRNLFWSSVPNCLEKMFANQKPRWSRHTKLDTSK